MAANGPYGACTRRLAAADWMLSRAGFESVKRDKSIDRAGVAHCSGSFAEAVLLSDLYTTRHVTGFTTPACMHEAALSSVGRTAQDDCATSAH